MSVAGAFRAWLGSAVACVALLAAWVTAAQLLTGRMTHLAHNVVDVSIGFGGIFALTAAVLYVPVFAAVGAALHHHMTRAMGILIGIALAPAAYLAIAWRFRDSDSPQTITALVLYWVAHLPEFALGILPFAIAGALFGILWSRSTAHA
jgi:hypothetical protein